MGLVFDLVRLYQKLSEERLPIYIRETAGCEMMKVKVRTDLRCARGIPVDLEASY